MTSERVKLSAFGVTEGERVIASCEGNVLVGKCKEVSRDGVTLMPDGLGVTYMFLTAEDWSFRPEVEEPDDPFDFVGEMVDTITEGLEALLEVGEERVREALDRSPEARYLLEKFTSGL